MHPTSLEAPMIRVQHVRNTISYVLLAKSIVGFSFALLTLLGVTLPVFGHELTAHEEIGAVGVGGVLGVIAALRA